MERVDLKHCTDLDAWNKINYLLKQQLWVFIQRYKETAVIPAVLSHSPEQEAVGLVIIRCYEGTSCACFNIVKSLKGFVSTPISNRYRSEERLLSAINLDAVGHRTLVVFSSRINSRALFFTGTQTLLSCHPLRSVHCPPSQNKEEEGSVAAILLLPQVNVIFTASGPASRSLLFLGCCGSISANSLVFVQCCTRYMWIIKKEDFRPQCVRTPVHHVQSLVHMHMTRSSRGYDDI